MTLEYDYWEAPFPTIMTEPLNIDELSALYEEHYGLMISVAARYVPQYDQVQDVLQQVFIDFVRFVGKYENCDPRRDAPRVLTLLAKTRAVEAWRNLRRFQQAGSEEIAEQLLGNLPSRNSAEDSGPKFFEEAESGRLEMLALTDCLKKLPEKSRLLIERHYFQKEPLKAIAEKSGSPPASLRKTMTRIRRILAECMTHHVDTTEK